MRKTRRQIYQLEDKLKAHREKLRWAAPGTEAFKKAKKMERWLDILHGKLERKLEKLEKDVPVQDKKRVLDSQIRLQ